MTAASRNRPRIRLRVLPRFPADLVGADGITIAKNGAVYTISVDIEAATGLTFPDSGTVVTSELVEPAGSYVGCRLTLTSGTPLTEADVPNAVQVYVTPSDHDHIGIYSGTNWLTQQYSELTVALDSDSGHTGYHQSGKNFDVFCAMSTGVVVAGTGPAWSSNTARGSGAGTTELEQFQGRLVNKNAITLRNGSTTYTINARCATFIGSFRCTANGQTSDIATKRFVSSLIPASRPMERREATTSWFYSTAVARQANNNTANQLEWLNCLAGRTTRVDLLVTVFNSGATYRDVVVWLELDGNRVGNWSSRQTSSYYNDLTAQYRGCAGIGYHVMKWIEYGAGADTQTWLGGSSDGLVGEVNN